MYKLASTLSFILACGLFIVAAGFVLPAISISLLSVLNTYAPNTAMPIMERFVPLVLGLFDLPPEGFIILLFGYPVWGFFLGVLGGVATFLGYFFKKKAIRMV